MCDVQVQETNSSLEQLWGNQVAQLPNLSSYLGGDAEPQSEVAASADADIAPPAEGLTDLPEQPTSPPAAADVPHEGSPDVTAAPLSDLRPQSPRRGRGRGQSRGRGRGRSSHPKGVIRLAGESDIAAGSTAAGSAESGINGAASSLSQHLEAAEEPSSEGPAEAIPSVVVPGVDASSPAGRPDSISQDAVISPDAEQSIAPSSLQTPVLQPPPQHDRTEPSGGSVRSAAPSDGGLGTSDAHSALTSSDAAADLLTAETHVNAVQAGTRAHGETARLGQGGLQAPIAEAPDEVTATPELQAHEGPNDYAAVLHERGVLDLQAASSEQGSNQAASVAGSIDGPADNESSTGRSDIAAAAAAQLAPSRMLPPLFNFRSSSSSVAPLRWQNSRLPWFC